MAQSNYKRTARGPMTRLRKQQLDQQCNQVNDGATICPVQEEPEVSISKYEKRKTEKYRSDDDAYIKNDGIEYNASNVLLSELFEDGRLPNEIHTSAGVESVRRSYLYIISKKVDNRTFVKIGISKLGAATQYSSRLGGLQTSLIPGLENIGFKIHYLFFYTRESKEKTSSFAELIEKELHRVLRNDEKYKELVLHFPTNNPSEWYLPKQGTYKEFIDFVIHFINMQTPHPEEGYHFYTRRGTEHRAYKDQFMKEADVESIRKYRKDFVKIKENIVIQRKLSAAEQQSKKGSKSYFIQKLMPRTNGASGGDLPLGDDIIVEEIYYHNKKTDTKKIRVHGQYYVKVKATDSRKNIKDLINVDYTEDKDGALHHWCSMYNVLSKMNELDTLERFGLLTNYNHYHDEPVYKYKQILNRLSDIDVRIKYNEAQWILGRYVRDSHGNVYKVTKLLSESRLVKHVIFQRVNENTMQVIEGEENQVKTHIIVALRLIVDYHEDRESQYSVLDTIDEKDDILTDDYPPYTFIKFRSDYFKEDGKPMKEEFPCIVLQKYMRFDEKSNSYELFYDLLFEKVMWRLKVTGEDGVNENSIIMDSDEEKRNFLEKVTYKKNLLTHLYQELSMDIPDKPQTSIPKALQTAPESSKGTRKSRRRRGQSPEYNGVGGRRNTSKLYNSKFQRRTRKILYHH